MLRYQSTESNLDASLYETKSLNAMVLRSANATNNALSYTSLPDSVRRKCNVNTFASPNLFRASLKRKHKIKQSCSTSKSLDDLINKENESSVCHSTPVQLDKSSIKMTAV